jgi:hypothetical protein
MQAWIYHVRIDSTGTAIKSRWTLVTEEWECHLLQTNSTKCQPFLRTPFIHFYQPVILLVSAVSG